LQSQTPPARTDMAERLDAVAFAAGRWRPLLATCLAIPMVVYAALVSGRWFAAPFPGFLMMENGVVATVSTFAWPADRALLFHSKIVSIDALPVRTSAEVYERVAARPPGSRFRYTLSKEGTQTTQVLVSRAFGWTDYVQTYGLILFVGSAYMAFGIVVGFLQPNRIQARVFLYQALIAGMYPITGVFLHQPDFPWLSRINLVCECFFGATWMHLALCFPLERRFVGAWRGLPLLPYMVSGVLAVFVLRGVFGEPADLTALHLTYSYSALSTIAFLVALAYSFWENREPIARLRIKAVFPGLLLASGPPFFAFVDNALSGRNFPVQFALVPIPILQASLAYAIVKHDLFDIDRVVRQSFVYGALTLVVAAAYTGTLLIPAWLVPSLAGTNPAVPSALFIVALALLLDPLRRGIQHVVDRAFYRSRLSYRATIEDLSELLATSLNPAEIAASVTRVLTDAMHLQLTRLCVYDGSACTVWSGLPGGVLSSQRIARDAIATHDDHTAQALTLESGGQTLGVLLLGAKRTSQPLDSEEIAILRTLAHQTAVALHNARSYAELQELNRTLDAKVQQQTEDLRRSNAELERAYQELKQAEVQLLQSEKLASLGHLVAGVAHEINNPASFVHGSLATLSDYIDRILQLVRGYQEASSGPPELEERLRTLRRQTRFDYVAAELPELLRICREGSERIGKIVGDLRTFARVENAEPEEVDLVESIETVVRLLGHRLSGGRVDLVRKFAPVPRVLGHPGQLSQVWMNLLTNAIDATTCVAKPRIEIAVEAVTVGTVPGVSVGVADNGPGIAAEHQGRLFEPFFTTKPVGAGTGLGLSIVYGAIRSHRGTIEIKSGQAGARAEVWLPIH